MPSSDTRVGVILANARIHFQTRLNFKGDSGRAFAGCSGMTPKKEDNHALPQP